MIRYIYNKEKSTVELLSGGSFEELENLINKFKDCSFIISREKAENRGVLVGGVYKTVISGIEHN